MINFVTTDEKHFRFDEHLPEIINYDGAEKHVVIPSKIDGMEVVYIGPDAFWNKNKGLTSHQRYRSSGFMRLLLTN
ncbi:hypothetical protein [Terrihalobacillus insolitus]|uniref:hypothetical protein n=1 Tax=Terrihalobacillus insolitus TaxID=2950438 RepID=UPI002340E432|nr:hypothetical protein [Terrihalobacillus insolitus]MDC3414506.1 hypothetical protein [Terrihalobacillus insolitus]